MGIVKEKYPGVNGNSVFKSRPRMLVTSHGRAPVKYRQAMRERLRLSGVRSIRVSASGSSTMCRMSFKYLGMVSRVLF